MKNYEEEIKRKKYQSDNIFPITRYLNLKDEILEEKKKMKTIKEENDTLLSIYNSRIKNSEYHVIEMSIKNTEENNTKKLNDIKNELKINSGNKYSFIFFISSFILLSLFFFLFYIFLLFF